MLEISNFEWSRIEGAGQGIDGIWFNSDDEMTNYSLTVRDSKGNYLGQYYYWGPGTDGIWFQ